MMGELRLDAKYSTFLGAVTMGWENMGWENSPEVISRARRLFLHNYRACRTAGRIPVSVLPLKRPGLPRDWCGPSG
jgi:hypothetical protein